MARTKQGCAWLPWLACALAGIAIAPAQTASEIVVHNFASPPKGANPGSGVIRDSAGNFYGTAGGGTAGVGVIYRLSSAGRKTTLYNFTGGADGGWPYMGVIGDSAGNLYGTTWAGGSFGLGVVYKLDPTGHETVLHNFTGGGDGGPPWAGVIRDSGGNLYGTTYYGGASGQGVVYKLDPAGNETVLYSFTGGADGGVPFAGVIRDTAGNLYGTTYFGGTANLGVVYKVDTAGHETVLYNFTRTAGCYPMDGVVRDPAGNLYGTADCGTAGAGVVYKLDPAGLQTVLYNFTGGADGAFPDAGVIRDAAGNLYGTTQAGGTGAGYAGYGVVYKLDTAGNQTVLYTFTGGADGNNPYMSGVIRDAAGNLYGTTDYGGIANVGVVYELDATGHETVLYSFSTATDGNQPDAALLADSERNLYGTTSSGGAANAGVVYQLDEAGNEIVLYSFTGGADGSQPSGGVIRDSAGNLYGTTQFGGAANAGVVYKLNAAGQETVLYSFMAGADGGNPVAGVVRDPAGNLYGTTQQWGSARAGVVYKLDPAGNETVLHNFTGGADGGIPWGGVIRDSAGNLYGTTYSGGIAGRCIATGFTGCGVVYKLDPAGNETVLYNFTGGADGGGPWAGVTRDSEGNLYGTTENGGIANGANPYGNGVVYKVDTAGHQTVLYSFTGGADGGWPVAGVVRDSAGNLYGSTEQGGPWGWGVVYMVDPAGQETVLYSFTGGADGGYPCANVLRGPAGNLYGTARTGGKYGGGVVYAIDVAAAAQ